MNLSLRLAPISCLVLACSLGPQPGAGDSSSTGSTTDTTTTAGHWGIGVPATGSDTSTGEPSSTSSTTAPEQTSSIAPPDGGGDHVPCDPYAQDCEPGEKCTWWANYGSSSWNATKCVPVADPPAQVGEPCVVEGDGLTGLDDCDLGAMCWDVDENNTGTCIALCGGDPISPTCSPGTGCASAAEGFALCIDTCDPLAQDCPGDDVCLPISDTYFCVLDTSGDEGQLHDPCEWSATCDPGLICVGPDAAVECDQAAKGCCEPMCDLNQPNTCPGAGQTCLPIYEPPPESFEHVGYCGVPQ